MLGIDPIGKDTLCTGSSILIPKPANYRSALGLVSDHSALKLGLFKRAKQIQTGTGVSVKPLPDCLVLPSCADGTLNNLSPAEIVLFSVYFPHQWTRNSNEGKA